MSLTIEDAAGGPRSLVDRIGIYPPLVWGYVGLLLFMIGDGVEFGYLSTYLTKRGIPNVSPIFTAYGLTAAIAAWFSGALSDLWGPRRVMVAGLGIWAVFEVALLLLGVAPNEYWAIFLFYALRGFGYPLFAYGFLVWITAVTPARRLGTAVGWFWFALTCGLMTLSSLLARFSIPRVGEYATLWISLGLVVVGGLIALIGVREPTGRHGLAPKGEKPVATLLLGITIALRKPKLAAGCVVRTINTASQYGFKVFLPAFFVTTVGFSQDQWFLLLSLMFLSNIVWNLLFGFIGDRLGWRRTVALCGGVGSAITTLLLYFLPHWYGTNFPLAALACMLYGATLAGFVPLSALMPSLEPRHRGAAMSMLNLGAGASEWVGPALVWMFLPAAGVKGVMFLFASLYLLSAVLTMFLTLPADAPASEPAGNLAMAEGA